MTPPSLPEFEAIAERYEMLGLLGQGGFGAVYKARQRSTGQLVAIKVLHADKLSHSTEGAIEAARFEREMRTIAELQHPNIVQLFDAGELPDGRLYAVLQFIDGIELEELIATEGPLAPREAVRLMSQVLDALSAAHALGVVHRDLKPANIMVTRGSARRNALVLDFGIAAIVETSRTDDYETLTAQGRIHGTPAYMAPEQLTQAETSPRFDIYAWGLTFIKALTGETVMRADSLTAILLRQASPEPVPIPQAVRSLPIGEVIERAVQKDPARRYQSAEHVLAALERSSGQMPESFGSGDVVPEPETMMLDTASGDIAAVSTSVQATTPPPGADQRLHEQRTASLSASSSSPPGQQVAAAVHERAPQQQPRSSPPPDDSDAQRSVGIPPALLVAVGVAAVVAVSVVVLLLVSGSGDDVESAEASDPSTEATTATVSGARNLELVGATDETSHATTTSTAPIRPEQPATAGSATDASGAVRGSEMVTLEGGRFEMGGASAALRAQCAELLGGACTLELFASQEPARAVRVASFAMDRHEVANRDYAECTKVDACRPIDYGSCRFMGTDGHFVASLTTPDQIGSARDALGKPELPVACVSWEEAARYCAWSGKRLPTEAEWEYAASHGGQRLYPFGDEMAGEPALVNRADDALASALGWAREDAPIVIRTGPAHSDSYAFTAPVTSFGAGATPSGLVSMAGNVREWTADHASPYPGSSATDDDNDVTARATRGGSWADVGPWLSTRHRTGFEPQTRRSDLGFRCARDAKPSP